MPARLKLRASREERIWLPACFQREWLRTQIFPKKTTTTTSTTSTTIPDQTIKLAITAALLRSKLTSSRLLHDTQVSVEGQARPTGGAAAIAMLVGPGAPIVFESKLRGSHMAHVYDFYKHDLASEYPLLAQKMPELLDFDKDLVHLEQASKIQLKNLVEEVQVVSKGLEKVEHELVASVNDGDISLGFQKTRHHGSFKDEIFGSFSPEMAYIFLPLSTYWDISPTYQPV